MCWKSEVLQGTPAISFVVVLSLQTRTTEVLFVLQFYHPDKEDKVDQ